MRVITYLEKIATVFGLSQFLLPLYTHDQR